MLPVYSMCIIDRHGAGLMPCGIVGGMFAPRYPKLFLLMKGVISSGGTHTVCTADKPEYVVNINQGGPAVRHAWSVLARTLHR